MSFTAYASIETVETRVQRARGGDTSEREALIRDYTPFILKTASTATRRFLVVGQDDEVSVALMAFDEALMAYSSPRPGFVAFAATVIRRRLIDYFRKERRKSETTFSALSNDDSEEPWAQTVASVEASPDWEETLERRDEMERWNEILFQYGLSIDRIVRCTPKHVDARERAIGLASIVARDSELREQFVGKRRLPVEELHAWLQGTANETSRKTIERQKDYITAIAVVFTFDFPTLRQFLDTTTAGGGGSES